MLEKDNALITKVLRGLPTDSTERRKLKSSLPFVTPSGIFTHRRASGLKARSGLLVLDFDHVPKLLPLRKALLADGKLGPSIALLFTSPSGDGLKVFVATDMSLSHKQNFQALTIYLQKRHSKWADYLDTKARDISRACFIPHDPEAYSISSVDNLVPFPVNLNELQKDIEKSQLSEASTKYSDLEPWINAVEQAGGFPDEYDQWLQLGFAFASLGEAGRSYFHRISKLSSKYQVNDCDHKFTGLLDDYDGRTTIKTFFWLCRGAGIEPSHEATDLATTPVVPELTYDTLPAFLRECCEPFKSGREKDVMLLSTVGILSGCFDTVTGIYDGSRVGLNLYCFIVAPAASGKSVMKWARHLAYPLHLARIKENTRPAQDGTNASESRLQQLYIPANNSAASIIKALHDNEGTGIICETEADTLGAALKQDWGNFSDLLRKAAHHEPYTYQRKSGNEYYELIAPCLSIVLTGTPGQVRGLIPSTEDGLFSRFMYYTFSASPKWRDVSPSNGRGDLTKYFDGLASQVTRYATRINTPVDIDLSEEQWQRLNAEGEKALAAAVTELGEDVASTVKRWGLIAFRLAMLFTLLRALAKRIKLPQALECHDMDFEAALRISSILREHAYTLFKSMPAQNGTAANIDRWHAKTLLRAEAIMLRAQGVPFRKIAKQLNQPLTTITRWVKS